MKALYYDTLAGPGAIRSGTLPDPEIGDTDVLVRVKAFSLNHVDLWVMNGQYPSRISLPHIFATDAAGLVEKIGRSVTAWKPGDEVIIHPGLSCGRCERCLSGHDNECETYSLFGVTTNGASAEYTRVPATNLFPKPEGLSFEEASTIGITYATAWNSLVLRAGIRQGDTVVVHGGGSGAGTAVIQVAKLFGANVIATVGDEWKVARAKELGVDVVVNHRTEDLLAAVKTATSGALADIVVDHVGASTFATSLAAVKRGGRLVTFGGTSGNDTTLSLRHVFGKNITIHGVYVGPKAAVFQYLPLFPQRLRPVIDSVFSFNDAAKAYEKLLSRQFFGKIVVSVP